MADEVARRRELRRKKILENAEERKRKIFGSNSYQNAVIQNGETPGKEVVDLTLRRRKVLCTKIVSYSVVYRGCE